MVEMIRLIPAARWCVTSRDLKFLRAEVWQGVQTQMIRPDDKDEFDSEDQVHFGCERFVQKVKLLSFVTFKLSNYLC